MKIKYFLKSRTAREKILEFKKAIRGSAFSERYLEFVVMKEMGWSWEELNQTPEEVYLDILRIISLKNKEEIRLESEISMRKR